MRKIGKFSNFTCVSSTYLGTQNATRNAKRRRLNSTLDESKLKWHSYDDISRNKNAGVLRQRTKVIIYFDYAKVKRQRQRRKENF